ncbi:unnamed protein product [Pedinophyceae sp. YPF-701]|nr:unnamed protein product [Pedinophyceae sp. YPF-701]
MGRGYKEAPWVFEGRALYQLNLVRSSEAKKYVPPDLKLVEFAGWTLGGWFLAKYDDSPAGQMQEFVALGGLVWNPPTSCAWAARVFVSAKEARDHGVTHVGLPSRRGTFSLEPSERPDGGPAFLPPLRKRRPAGFVSWWQAQNQPKVGRLSRRPAEGMGMHGVLNKPPNADELREEGIEADSGVVTIRNAERGYRGLDAPVCSIELPAAAPAGQWAPRLKIPLPSFSGNTDAVPGLLRYACNMLANVRFVRPCRVHLHEPSQQDAKRDPNEQLHGILAGKPLLCIAFDSMKMSVGQPEVMRTRRRRLKPALA